MYTYVLIIIIATSASSSSGTGALNQEFSNKARCLDAGQALVEAATKKNNYVNITWGCFQK